jgi:hypothetical protein
LINYEFILGVLNEWKSSMATGTSIEIVIPKYVKELIESKYCTKYLVNEYGAGKPGFSTSNHLGRWRQRFGCEPCAFIPKYFAEANKPARELTCHFVNLGNQIYRSILSSILFRRLFSASVTLYH